MIPNLTKLALLGGPPIYTGEWPSWPRVVDIGKVLAHFETILKTPRWTIRVPGQDLSIVEKFEMAWAEHCGSRFALAVTSGSSALELALRGLDIKRGDEVIVPALGWYATAAAVCRVGAKPVFADVNPQTTCLDAKDVERCLSPCTVAVIAVHLHCALADLDALTAITEAHHLWLIEDAAQAHGASYFNRPVGSIGRIGCFSFNQEKLLAVGEGGAVVTSDSALYRRLYALRTDGYQPLTSDVRNLRSDGMVQGGNMCLSELQAVLLLDQLSTFDEENKIRSQHAAALEEALEEIPEITALTTAPGTTSRPYYEFGFTCASGQFGDWPLTLIAQALSAELNIDIHLTDVPVEICPQFAHQQLVSARPYASQVYNTLLVFHHRHLLSPDIITALPAALHKVISTSRALPANIVTRKFLERNKVANNSLPLPVIG